METPFQVNLSVILAKVFLNPRCPEVGSVWQALAILFCSSLFLMYLISIPYILVKKRQLAKVIATRYGFIAKTHAADMHAAIQQLEPSKKLL